MAAPEHLEAGFFYLSFDVRVFEVVANIFEKVRHYNASRPDVYFLMIVLLENYYFWRAVESCGYMRGKPPLEGQK